MMHKRIMALDFALDLCAGSELMARGNAGHRTVYEIAFLNQALDLDLRG